MTGSIIGSVSHGTMRPQDLIPTFFRVLGVLDPEALGQIEENCNVHVKSLLELEDDHPWWNSEAASWLLNEYLFNALNEYAPEGRYFGSRHGGGSDYGFWEPEDELTW